MDLSNKPAPFQVGDFGSASHRWKKWVRELELFFVGADIQNDVRKKALLLNLAGKEVLEIYDNLPGENLLTYQDSDYFSRHPLASTSRKLCEENFINLITDLSLPKALSRVELVKATARDRTLQRVLDAVTPLSWDDPLLSPFKPLKEELAVTSDGLILKGCRIVIPERLENRIIELAHTGHQGITKTKELLRSKVWFPNMTRKVEEYIKRCTTCIANSVKVRRDPH